MRALLVGLAALLAGACTSVQVQPVSGEYAVDHVVIERNPSVEDDKVLYTIQDALERHGMGYEVVEPGQVGSARFTARYAASTRWDVRTYLDHAEISLWHRGQRIGLVLYHLKGGGGVNPRKYADTRSKLAPLLDQMLKAYALP